MFIFPTSFEAANLNIALNRPTESEHRRIKIRQHEKSIDAGRVSGF